MKGLRIAIPPERIDSSYLNSLGLVRDSRRTILSALRFLRLVGADYSPTPALIRLAELEGSEYVRELEGIVRQGYALLFDETDIQRSTTRDQLSGYFRRQGIKGETVRKCASFFINIAEEANIPLSPHISGVTKRGEPSQRGRQRKRASPSDYVPARRTISRDSKEQLLIDKFPSFDPTWSDEVKIKWFDDFAELMRRVSSQG